MNNAVESFQMEGCVNINQHTYRFRINVNNKITFISCNREYDKYFPVLLIKGELNNENDRFKELIRIIKRGIINFYKDLSKLKDISNTITINYNDEGCFTSITIKLKLV